VGMGSAASHDVLVPEAGSSLLYESATATSFILNNVKSSNRPDGLAFDDEGSPFCHPSGFPRTSYSEPSLGWEVLILESSRENFSAKKFNEPRFIAQMDAFPEGGPLNAGCDGSVDIERAASGSYEIAPYDISNDIVSVAGAGSPIDGRSANPAKGGAKNALPGNSGNSRSLESFGSIDTLVAGSSSPIRHRWRVHLASICLQTLSVSMLASHPLWWSWKVCHE
jgi:hypothetical protein